MRHLIGLVACVALMLGGCGKKKEVEIKKRPVAMLEEPTALTQAEEEYVFDNELPEEELVAFGDEEGDDSEQEAYESFAAAEDSAGGDSMKSAFDEDDLTISWEEEENDLDFQLVQFGLNKDQALSGQEDIRALNIERAKEAVERGDKIVLHAHACQLGEGKYNIALTQRRAESEKRKYVEAGIPEESIVSVARGQEAPLVPDDEDLDLQRRIEKLSANRRVEVKLEPATASAA